MIKAVIFDCFGVLAYDGWLAFKDKYLEKGTDAYDKALASNKRVDAGFITYDQFVTEIAALAKVSQDETRQTLENNPPNGKLFAYIRKNLKPRYKIGMLSNAGDNWLPDIFDAPQINLFDEIVLSYQIGAIKPEPAMYEAISMKLGVLPEECVFIDDQERYCDGARHSGMKAVVFRDTDETIVEIERLLRA